MEKIGYARVSSLTQLKGGGLEIQRQELLDSGCDEVYEEQFTGASVDRPIFNKILRGLESGDTLVVTSVDRFARSMSEGMEVLRELISDNIKIHVLDVGVIENTPMGKFIFRTILSFSEFEKDIIAQRTRKGKELARTKEGYKEGRPKKYSEAELNFAMSLLDDGYSYTQVESMQPISKSTLVRYRREQKEGENSEVVNCDRQVL